MTKQYSIAGVTQETLLQLLNQLIEADDKLTTCMAEQAGADRYEGLLEQEVKDAEAMWRSGFLNEKGPFKNEATMKLEIEAALGDLRHRFNPRRAEIVGMEREMLGAPDDDTEPPEDLGPASASLWRAWRDAQSAQADAMIKRARAEIAQVEYRTMRTQMSFIAAWLGASSNAKEIDLNADESTDSSES